MSELEDAVASCETALELHGDYPLALLVSGMSLTCLGNHEPGLEQLAKGVAMTHRSPLFVGMLGHARARAGDVWGARELLAELEKRTSGEYVSPMTVLNIQLGLGDRDGVERGLRAAVEDHMPPITMALLPPDALAELASEPGFVELYRELRLPVYLDGG
jgi:hypothetical protein